MESVHQWQLRGESSNQKGLILSKEHFIRLNKENLQNSKKQHPKNNNNKKEIDHFKAPFSSNVYESACIEVSCNRPRSKD